MSAEQWLTTNGSDLVRVLYGLDALDSGIVRELPQLVDDRSGRLITIDVLEWDEKDSKWKAVAKPNQHPPFKNQGELAYDLFKRAETAAWWLANPAISKLYCLDHGFVAGNRTCIALLAKLSDRVGPGTYRGDVLSWDRIDVNDERWVVVEKDLQRYGVCGLFHNPKKFEKDVIVLLKLADAPDVHHRFTALWALSKIAREPEFNARIQKKLTTAKRDPSSHIREFSEKTLNSSAHAPAAPAKRTVGGEKGGISQERKVEAPGSRPVPSGATLEDRRPILQEKPASMSPRLKTLLVVLGIGVIAWIVLRAFSIL